MKLTMEIQGHSSGESPSVKKPGEMVLWTTIWGFDSNGRYARVKTFDKVATALNASINSKLDKDEVVSGKRLVINLTGEWKTQIYVNDGKEEKSRVFWAHEFNILDGMALEAARLRRDAISTLHKAEKLRTSGQLALAYEAVGQFVANYAGVPLDLEKFLADSAADDAEFGASSGAVEIDPEALAAAHFAREDRVKESAVDTTKADAVAEADVEQTVSADEQTEPQAPMEFGADEVLGDDDAAVSDVLEEDAIVLDTSSDTDDVLEDNTPAQESAPKPETPAFGQASPFGARPSAFQPQSAAASKPFSRPEISRQASQPVARPAPVAAPASSAPPFMASRPRF